MGSNLNGRVFRSTAVFARKLPDVPFADPLRLVNCYGTLIDFRVGDVARDRLADRVPPGRMAGFLEDFTAYRFHEVLGAWKPYPEVLHGSLERTCRRWGSPSIPADAQ